MRSLVLRLALGNAKIEGLLEDLNLSGQEYNVALSLFFIPYILLGKLFWVCEAAFSHVLT